VRRLEREARAASALNHPNIVTIHDIGEEDGTLYVAMEFVEGQTLRAILREGTLRPERMLRLATQIAEGLAKAHAAGIVHRDLKPANLMVTGDGHVKILDFGLAKRHPQAGEAGSDLATATTATRDGAIVGTVQYMSPEQAAGRPVDYRSDYFSFGSILYEMATGEVAFERETVPQTQAAIIEDEPEPMDPGNLPPHFPAIVERCLAKSPEERYDSRRDLARELKSLLEAPSGRRAARGAAARQPELAVLPLQNLSGDPEQEYFSDGMTEALIADLARIKALHVISRQPVMRYKGSDQPLPEIARELGVDAVLEGSVLRAGDRVRVTAQVIDATADRHLWADRFDRELRDILSRYSDLARAIAGEIQASLTPEEEASLSRVRPVSSESYDLYLMGRHHSAKRTPEPLGRAIEYFQKAIETDPTNALAHSGLADAYAFQAVWGFAPPIARHQRRPHVASLLLPSVRRGAGTVPEAARGACRATGLFEGRAVLGRPPLRPPTPGRPATDGLSGVSGSAGSRGEAGWTVREASQRLATRPRRRERARSRTRRRSAR
jgi:TolB-like protein